MFGTDQRLNFVVRYCSAIHRFTATMAEDLDKDKTRLETTKSSYETDSLLCQYLSLHFGPLEIAFADFLAEQGILSDGLDFPRKCGDLVNSWGSKAKIDFTRALDLGCAVGMSTFELARCFQEVIGIDISQRFIDAADQMKRDKAIEYELKVEGDICEKTVARIDGSIDTARTTFLQVGHCSK
jgi:2-polyprenyl-3-methyl-5-hydroxy-6-metoxy-1,4-benzoquinol methylase